MRDNAVTLLNALGVTGAADDPLLGFIVKSVRERILNETNQTKMPDGLRFAAAEMVAGEYLSLKKASGQLDIDTLDLDAAIKSIQEGDTTISYAIGSGSLTPEQRLDNLIDHLINGRRREFIRYRRLVW